MKVRGTCRSCKAESVMDSEGHRTPFFCPSCGEPHDIVVQSCTTCGKRRAAFMARGAEMPRACAACLGSGGSTSRTSSAPKAKPGSVPKPQPENTSRRGFFAKMVAGIVGVLGVGIAKSCQKSPEVLSELAGSARKSDAGSLDEAGSLLSKELGGSTTNGASRLLESGASSRSSGVSSVDSGAQTLREPSSSSSKNLSSAAGSAARGPTRTIDICSKCDGGGTVIDYRGYTEICSRCQGTGMSSRH